MLRAVVFRHFFSYAVFYILRHMVGIWRVGRGVRPNQGELSEGAGGTFGRSGGGGGGWHEAMVLVCLPLAAPIGLSPLHLLTLCGSECVLVVSTEPLDDLTCPV